MTTAPPELGNPRWVPAFALLVLLAWILICTHPDIDGDVWWHMAYGRQMLQSNTLKIDHSIYTWTATSNDTIYCAWIPEIVLHLLYNAAGLTAHYALRYAFMAVFIVLVWWHARRMGVAEHPLFWLISLLSLTMSALAATFKPQSFSFVLMALTAFTWRQIHRTGPNAWRACYALPLLMLVWVNCHGAFLFGLAFLAVMGLGEHLNALYSPQLALPLGVRRHLFPALILCVGATCLNPYGVDYPFGVVRGLLTVSTAHLETVDEYKSIFGAGLPGLHFIDLGALSLALVAVAFVASWPSRGMDWPHALATMLFVGLYVRYVRTTIFWPPVFAFTATHLLAKGAARLTPVSTGSATKLAAGSFALALTLVARLGYDSVAHGFQGCGSGFGIGHRNPVEEAEFLAKHFSRARLGNDYGSGAYLLWRLWPQNKVFIDARYFPFSAWYDDYRKLITTNGIEHLLRRFPCDAWCIGMGNGATLTWFLGSPDWKPVFYGASAAIFARKERAMTFHGVQAGSGITDIKELAQARDVLLFAMRLRDWAGAERIMAAMERSLRSLPHGEFVRELRAYLTAQRGFHGRQYAKTLALLEASAGARSPGLTEVMAACYRQLSVEHWARNEDASALQRAEAGLALAPDDAPLLFNAGAIQQYLDREQPWRPRLVRFLRRSRADGRVPQQARQLALLMLEGQFSSRPKIISIPPRERCVSCR